MKLIDFFDFKPLNDLKESMGIPRDVYGAFSMSAPNSLKLTPSEAEAFSRGDSIDVSLDDVIENEDGTLIYKDARVFLYIRDVHPFQKQVDLPKFHIARCNTLANMNSIGRSHRYLISSRADGNFKLNVIRGNISVEELRPLNVCQNCLAALEFNGFKNHLGRIERTKHVKEFSPDKFFLQYPRLLDGRKHHQSDYAPLNAYPADFHLISLKVRSSVGWKCEEPRCRFDCSSLVLRPYLHVHHVDGNRANSDRSNLRAICIECHAKQPRHSHMRNVPQFKTFQTLRYSRFA